MLIEGADSVWRELLENLFAATDELMLERAFEGLRAESDYRQAQNEKAEREHRRKTGAPSHARMLDAGALEAAFEEWDLLTKDNDVAAAPAPAAPEADV